MINYLALLGWGYDETTTFFTTEELQQLLLARARLQEPCGLRRAEAALDQRPLRARAAGRRPDARAWRSSRAAPAWARRSRSRRRRSRRSTSSGRWPARSSTVRSMTRRRARSSSSRDESRTRSRRRARRWRRSRSRGPSRTSRRRCAESSSGRASSRSKIFQPLRVALTGTTVSPGIFETVALLGRDETLASGTRLRRGGIGGNGGASTIGPRCRYRVKVITMTPGQNLQNLSCGR